jgi:hypothetical protein
MHPVIKLVSVKAKACSRCIEGSTYPQNSVSRISTYRNLCEACQRAGTDTDSQMRALVGRRIHASAASSSDRRNLHEHEHEPKVAPEHAVNSSDFHDLL